MRSSFKMQIVAAFEALTAVGKLSKTLLQNYVTAAVTVAWRAQWYKAAQKAVVTAKSVSFNVASNNYFFYFFFRILCLTGIVG